MTGGGTSSNRLGEPDGERPRVCWFWSVFSRRWAACARLEHFLSLQLPLGKGITEVKRASCSFCAAEGAHMEVFVRGELSRFSICVPLRGAPGLSEAPHLTRLFRHQKRRAVVACVAQPSGEHARPPDQLAGGPERASTSGALRLLTSPPRLPPGPRGVCPSPSPPYTKRTSGPLHRGTEAGFTHHVPPRARSEAG